jgi:hypothetical protein
LKAPNWTEKPKNPAFSVFPSGLELLVIAPPVTSNWKNAMHCWYSIFGNDAAIVSLILVISIEP